MSEAEAWVSLDEVPSIADERAYHALTNGSGPDPAEEDTWLPRNLAELDDEPPVKPTLGGLGIVYPGKRHVFSGPQESAKTLAAYVIGLEVIRAGQKVVLIDFEMGQWDARRRLLELGATDEELAGFLYVEPDSPAGESDVDRLVGATPGLVVVDAAAGAFDLEGLDDNKRQDVERWASRWIVPFWKAGIATVVLDHVVKNAEARGKYAIGSERKVGGADVHLGFEVVHPIKRGGHGLYKVVTHKDRGGFLKRGKLAEFELTSDPETHVIAWAFNAPSETDDDAPFRPTELMEKVSRYVERQVGSVSIGDVKTNVTGKAQYLIDAVQHLVDDGFLEESEGPRSARMFESIQAYRKDEDRPVPDPFPPVPEGGSFPPVPRSPSIDGNGSGNDLGDGNGSQRSLEEDDDGIPF